MDPQRSAFIVILSDPHIFSTMIILQFPSKITDSESSTEAGGNSKPRQAQRLHPTHPQEFPPLFLFFSCRVCSCSCYVGGLTTIGAIGEFWYFDTIATWTRTRKTQIRPQ